MPTIIDSLVVELGFDVSGFKKGQKEAASSALYTTRELDKIARDAQRDLERSLAARAKAEQKAITDRAKAVEKIERDANKASARAAKERVDAQKKAAKDSSEAQDKFNETLSATGRRLLGLYALFTAGRGIKDFVGHLTTADAAMGRFATSVGMAPSAVSNLGLAIERSGGNATAAAQGYQALSDAIAAIKTGHASESFLQAIGMLSTSGGAAIDLNASREKQMAALGADIYKLAQKDAGLASSLGRQAGLSPDLINWMIANSPQQQAAELARSGRLGGASPESIKASQELIKQYAAMKQASEDLGRQIFVGLAPAINDVLKGTLDWVEANKAWLKTEIGDQVKAFVDYLKGVDWKGIGADTKALASDANAAANAFGGWKNVIEGIFGLWVGAKFASAMTNLIRFMSLMRMPLPAWALMALGVGGAYAAGKAIDYGVDKSAEAAGVDQMKSEMELDKRHLGNRTMSGRALDWMKGKLGFGNNGPTGNDALWARSHAGEKARQGAKGYTGREGGNGTAAPPPGPAGTYRPQYRLGSADLSDAVLNKVAGEARAFNQDGVDAVLNNMFNRLGTHTYGPSSNLQDVATAPGQYTGFRRPGAKEAEFIRSRIRAIAAGSVADNTNGSNEYRADWYHGPWGWKHPDGINVGGNVFAYNPKGGRGPYGPYAKPNLPTKTPPMQREKQSWWTGAPGSADYANHLTSMAASSVTHHNSNVDNSQRSTHVGSIVLQTQAKDGAGVADELRRDLQRRGLMGQPDYGIA